MLSEDVQGILLNDDRSSQAILESIKIISYFTFSLLKWLGYSYNAKHLFPIITSHQQISPVTFSSSCITTCISASQRLWIAPVQSWTVETAGGNIQDVNYLICLADGQDLFQKTFLTDSYWSCHISHLTLILLHLLLSEDFAMCFPQLIM